MNHKRASAVAGMVAALGMALASNAQAAQVGFYIGGFVAQTDKEANKRDFDVYAAQVYDSVGLTVLNSSSSIDDSFIGYGFYGGYRFTSHFAVEGGYLNLGSLKYRSRALGVLENEITTNAIHNLDSETAGIAVSALGVWPINYRWEVFGRAGVLFASNTASEFYAETRRTASGEFSENSVDFLAGVGTSFTFLEIYDLRLEYQLIFDAGHEATGEGNAGVLSLGVAVAF